MYENVLLIEHAEHAFLAHGASSISHRISNPDLPFSSMAVSKYYRQVMPLNADSHPHRKRPQLGKFKEHQSWTQSNDCGNLKAGPGVHPGEHEGTLDCDDDEPEERKSDITGNFSEPKEEDTPPNIQHRDSKASSYHQSDFHPWHPGDPHVHRLPQQDSWEHCRKLASGYDDDMCRSWKAEIDNLLIFAGLFSAAVTAFTIDSYKWLQPDSNTQVLSLIYEHLNPIAGSQILSSVSDPVLQGPIVRINIYWFLSLTLGLATVLVGIIIAQWLREYEREVPLPSKGRLALRQMRYEGLIYWEVPRIIALLPLLLQAAFILFLVGILELLWTLDRMVAIPVTVLTGLVFLFLCVTVALPTIQYIFPGDRHLRVPQCAYKSPQSLGTLRFVLAVIHLFPKTWKIFLNRYSTVARLINSSYHWSWPQFDVHWRELRDAQMIFWGTPIDIRNHSHDIVHALDWLVGAYHETTENILAIFHCVQDLPASAGIEVIHKIGAHFNTQALEDFNNMLQDDQNVSTDIQKDIMAIAFLHSYRPSHPLLETYYWESQVRLMNSRSISRRLVGWSADNLSFEELPHDVQLQLLMALNGLLQSDLASPSDIHNTWQILRSLMSPTHANIQAANSRLDLTFDLFESLSSWLTYPGDLDIQNRIKLSMDGVRILVYEGFCERWETYSGYDKVMSFMRKLDGTLRERGGTANVIHLEKNSHISFVEDTWPEYMEWVFTGA